MWRIIMYFNDINIQQIPIIWDMFIWTTSLKQNIKNKIEKKTLFIIIDIAVF